MDKLIELLESVKADVDYKNEKRLIDDGILDSFDIVSIITAIDEEFDVTFPVMEIMPETFNSVESIYAVIKKLEEE